MCGSDILIKEQTISPEGFRGPRDGAHIGSVIGVAFLERQALVAVCDAFLADEQNRIRQTKASAPQ
jgi:hypothetical protein